MGGVWFDLVAPKDVLYFERAINSLRRSGCEVLVTSRRYYELLQLCRLRRLETVIVGRYGGAELIGKLLASARRVLKLVDVVYRFKPKVAVSFASPEAARVAFGLGIPHICADDAPNAESVAKLTIPLSSRLITPSIIGEDVWVKYGISRDNIVTYNAIDPAAWIKWFKPRISILRKLNLDVEKPIITLRPEETFASYLRGFVNLESIYLAPLVRDLTERLSNIQIVIIPRYPEQREAYYKLTSSLTIGRGNRVVITDRALDTQSLIYYSSVFIGAGGTMSWEASLLGVPAISCYPAEPTIVDKYLMELGLLKRLPIDRVLEYVEELLTEDIARVKRKLRVKARKILLEMEDPTDVVLKCIYQYLDR
jgi:predicted glycosyltransferase